MRPSAAAAFSPRPARGGSRTTRSSASLEERSARNSFGCCPDALHVGWDVALEIGERVRRRFHGQHLIEVACQALGKQSGAGVKVQRGAASAVGNDDLDQLVDEKAVGLEEGAGADPVVGSHSVVHKRLFADGLKGF